MKRRWIALMSLATLPLTAGTCGPYEATEEYHQETSSAQFHLSFDASFELADDAYLELTEADAEWTWNGENQVQADRGRFFVESKYFLSEITERFCLDELVLVQGAERTVVAPADVICMDQLGFGDISFTLPIEDAG